MSQHVGPGDSTLSCTCFNWAAVQQTRFAIQASKNEKKVTDATLHGFHCETKKNKKKNIKK